MQKILYEKFFNMEKEHWWFQARKDIVLKLISLHIELKKNFKIMDIGCGTGMMLEEIKNKFSITAIGIDNSEEAVRFSKKRGLNIILSSAEKIEQNSESIDLIMALDLIEHIENDIASLKEFNRVLKKNGYVLLTVPAFNCLTSAHDVINEHKRRYQLGELKNKVEEAGFKVIKISYYNSLLFLPILIVKVIKKITIDKHDHLKKENYIVNAVLNKIFSSETFLLKYFDLPIGASIICLAKKK